MRAFLACVVFLPCLALRADAQPIAPDGGAADGATLDGGASPAPCSDGRISVDGGCCWPGQRFSPNLALCVGAPSSCPEGRDPVGESCEPPCAPGTMRTDDTAGRCCWPGQAFSTAASECVGAPRCPEGTHADGERCVAGASPPSPAATGVQVFLVPELHVHSYVVDVDARRKPCSTPCVLRLPPGFHTLSVEGDVHYRRSFGVPDRPVRVIVRQPIWSRVIAASIVGAGGFALGGVGLGLAVDNPGTSLASNTGTILALAGLGAAIFGLDYLLGALHWGPVVKELGEDREVGVEAPEIVPPTEPAP